MKIKPYEKIPTVYLGGTNSGSEWRSEFIPQININSTILNIDIEDNDYILYVITPVLSNFRIITEIFKSAKNNPEKTIVCFLESDICPVENKNIFFDDFMIEFFEEMEELLNQYFVETFWCLESVANYVNEP